MTVKIIEKNKTLMTLKNVISVKQISKTTYNIDFDNKTCLITIKPTQELKY